MRVATIFVAAHPYEIFPVKYACWRWPQDLRWHDNRHHVIAQTSVVRKRLAQLQGRDRAARRTQRSYGCPVNYLYFRRFLGNQARTVLCLPPEFRRVAGTMSKSRKTKARTAASSTARDGDCVEESAHEDEKGWRWELADRPLSMKQFAERAAALQRELRSSIDSTKIIRAHRDGCCCELDECSSRMGICVRS